MQKINFINNSQPAINDTNLNKLQQNVEDDIGDLTQLETSAKDNLVEAINEAKRSGGDTLPIYSIVDYDGDTVPSGYEEVSSYSTEEVKTGDTWIDGKPIYRKVLTGNSGDLQNMTTVNIGQNVSKVLKIDGFISDSSNNYIPINYANGGAPVWAYWNTNNLKIQSSVNYFSNMPYYIIVEYTKD